MFMCIYMCIYVCVCVCVCVCVYTYMNIVSLVNEVYLYIRFYIYILGLLFLDVILLSVLIC